MTFHESFWVLTGTAAPVIALAAIVSGNEAFGLRIADWPPQFFAEGDRDYKATQKLILDVRSSRALLALYVNSLNVLVQTIVLVAALMSLAGSRDLWWSWSP